MKRYYFALFLSFCFVAFHSNTKAQQLDEIINKHIKAHGGAKKWSQIKTIKAEGTFTGYSIEKPFTSYISSQNECYYDYSLTNNKIIQAFDGKKGWTVNLSHDIPYSRLLKENETYALLQKSDFFTPFYRYKEKGYKVKYLGTEDLDGTKMHILEIKRFADFTEKWYLNAKTYLEYKCETYWVDYGSTHPAEIYYDDFRKVDGITIPFYVERIFSQRDRIWQTDKIEINANFNRNLLERPNREEMKKINFLLGKWEVKSENFNKRRKKWFPIETFTCEFKFKKTNIIEANILVPNWIINQQILQITATNNQFQMVVFDDLNPSFTLFDGKFEKNTFTFDNIKFASKLASQYIFELQNNGDVILSINMSNDKGKTWKKNHRLTYHKID